MDNLKSEYKKAVSKFKNDSRIKECFHFDHNKCDENIIRAHSLQKNGVLSLLEEEVNGNLSIYSFLHKEINNQLEPVGFIPMGKKETSTFHGFCKHHDLEIFKPIENYDVDLENDEHCFLLTYRAFAKDFHAKYESIQGYKKNSQMHESLPNFIEQIIAGSELGNRDGIYVKNRFNEILQNRNYEELEYFTYKLNYRIPLALASSMTPDFYMTNKAFNLSVDPKVIYEHVNFVVLPTKNYETLILLSCLPEHKKAINFIDQIHDLPKLKLLKIFTSLAIGYVENTFISPRLYNKLNSNEKKQLIYELKISNPIIRSSLGKFFTSKLNFFDERFKD